MALTTQFQWVIDNASDLLINKRAVVAQTVARDQTVRATSRGGQIWRFTINPGHGHLWTDIRSQVEGFDTADKFTATQITFGNNANLNYLFKYQGNATSLAGLVATYTQGSNVITISGGTCTSGNILVSGDLIQFAGSNRVYSVAADVPFNATSVTLNRPVLEASAVGTAVTVGPAVNFAVICTQLPDWKIANDGSRRVEWSGPFVFMESLTS